MLQRPPLRARARALASSRGDRAAVRLPDHQLDGRDVDRRGRPHPLRAARHADMKQVPTERRTSLRVADREPLRTSSRASSARTWSSGRSGSSAPSSSSSWPRTGSAWSPASARSAGATRPRTGFQLDEPLLPRGECRRQPDARDGARLLRAAGSSGRFAKSALAGSSKELFAPKGTSTGALKVLLIVVFFAGGMSRGRLDSVPARLAELPALRQHLRRREHARDDGGDSAIGWLVQVPFYFLELLVGLVQALVFMLLTAVFTLLICQHHEDGTGGAHD